MSNFSNLFFLTFASAASVEDLFCATGAAVSVIGGCNTRRSTSLFSGATSCLPETTTIFIAALIPLLTVFFFLRYHYQL